MSQMERVYYFHKEVMANRYPNSRSIMDRFEVSEASARRDINYLRDNLAAPLEFDRNKNGWFYTSTDFSLPFENNVNLITYLAIIQKIADECGLSELPELKRFKERLFSLIGSDGKKLMEAVSFEKIETSEVSVEKLKTVFDAICGNVDISINYRKINGDETIRVVTPLKLVNYQWRWYLVGFCHLRKSPRIFHFARIKKIRLTDKRSSSKRLLKETLDKLLEGAFGIFKGTSLKYVKILFSGDAAGVVEEQVWHKDQRLERVGKDLILTLPVADYREVSMKILQFGRKAQVLEPQELKELIVEEAERMLENYGIGNSRRGLGHV